MARANQRILDLEEGILNSVELLDSADGSRFSLLNTLDSVRTNLVNSYGDSFEEDYNELLGVNEDSEESDEDDSEELDEDDEDEE